MAATEKRREKKRHKQITERTRVSSEADFGQKLMLH